MANSFNKILVLVLCIVALASCKNDEFQVDAKLNGVGTESVRVVYATADGVTDFWMMPAGDIVSFKGYSEQPTLLGIYNASMQPLVRIIVKNGEHVQVKGDFTDPFSFESQGSEATEHWLTFMREHQQDILAGHTAAVDSAIEEYVNSNPEDVTSTMLLLTMFSDITNLERVDALLLKITPEARPDILLATYNGLRPSKDPAAGSHYLTSMSLITLKDKYGDIVTTGRKGYTTIWLWNDDRKEYNATVDSLKSLKKRMGKRLQVADVYCEADTMAWRRTMQSDSTIHEWDHYWAPSGTMYRDLSRYHVSDVPSFMVVDSTGRVVHRSENLRDYCTFMRGK